jgi:heat shock protein HtpX
MAGAIMMLASMARWTAIFGGGRGSDERGGMSGIGLIAMSFLAPIGAMIIQMAISRSREYLADASGAAIAGRPDGLAKALAKLGAYSKRIPMKANASTAHMFIVNPLTGRGLMSLFSTHPPLEDRIAKLTGRPMDAPSAGSESQPRSGGHPDARNIWDQLKGGR